MQTLGSYITQVRTLVNDTSSAIFSNTQMTNFVNQARGQVSFDTKCIRTFFQGLNTINTQEAYLYNGSVGGLKLVSGGHSYTAPNITISGGGGTGATAHAIVMNGVIIGTQMNNWGSGYTSVPTVTVTDSTGSGASLSPIWLNNIFDILNVSILWGSERLTLGWLEFTRFQTFCRAFTSNFSRPGIFSMYQSANLVYLYPIPNQVYGLELDVTASSKDLVNLTDNDTQILPPYDTGVPYYAAFLALLSIQDDRHPIYFKGDGSGLYEIWNRKYPAQVYTRRIFNPYYSGLPRLRRM